MTAPRAGWQTAIGFLVSGTLAFITDVAVTRGLGFAGVPTVASRVGGIAVAMVVAWACHRRLTFAVSVPPSVAEFMRYVAVGWTAALVNYLVFVALLWGVTGLDTTIAIAVSSLVAMAYSFVGMRFGVFTRR